MLGSPNKDKCFGDWSLIYLLPTKPTAGQPQGDPSLSAREGKKQTNRKHLACITNSNFCIQGLLNLTSAHECERVAAVIQVTWQCKQTSLEQGSQTYGGLLGAKTSWKGNGDETQCPRKSHVLAIG